MSAPGTIGYADMSKAGSLGVVSIKVGDAFNAPSAAGAAATLTASERKEGNGPNDIIFDIARTTTDASAYPMFLLSYVIAGLTMVFAGAFLIT